MSVLPKVIRATKSKKKYLLFYGTLPSLLTACIGWRRDPEPEDKQPATPAPNPAPASPKPAAKDIATPDNDMIKLDGKILEVDALAGDDKVLGSSAAETIKGGDGADLLRGGQGADKIYGGAGVDHIVLVGANSNGKYTIDDIKNPNGTGVDLSNIVTLAEVNDGTSDAEAGEVIDGGADGANLFIFGQVDLSQVTLSNVTQIQVQSTLTITAQQILDLQAQGLTKIIGDGTTEIIIPDSETAVTINLENLEISHLDLLSVGKNVTLILDKEDIANIHIVEGDGVLQAANGTLEVADKKFQVNTKIFNEGGISESYMDIQKAAVGDVIDPIKVYELKDGESATYELYVHEGFDLFVDGQQLTASGNADFKADHLQGIKLQQYEDVIGYFESYKGADAQTTLKYELTQDQLNKLELKANQGIEGYDSDSGSDTGFGVYSIVANITHKDGSTSKSIGGEMVAFGVWVEGSNDANNFYNPAQDHTLYFIEGKEGYNEILIDYNFSSAKFVLDKDGIWIFADENGDGGSDNHNSYHLKNIDKIGFKDLGIYSNQIILEAIKPGGQSSDELYAWLKAHHKNQFKHEDVLSDGGKISGPVSDGDDQVNISVGNQKIIQTGAGDDNVSAASDNLILMTGSGNDLVDAVNAHNSAIFMGSGDDELLVQDIANNSFHGGDGTDTAIFAGAVNINLFSQNEKSNAAKNKYTSVEVFKLLGVNDRFVAGSEDITIYGNDGNSGNDGNDHITAKSGKVTFIAGSRDDRYDAGTGGGLFDGGDGIDTVTFSKAATLDLVDQSKNEGAAKGLEVKNIEGIIGSAENDSFYLNESDINWQIQGGDGEDMVSYRHFTNENLPIITNLGANTSQYNGRVSNLSGIENIEGTSGNDSIVGSDEDNKLYGLGGNDSLIGGLGNDTLDGGEGNNKLYGNDGDDVLIAGSGQNEFYGGAGRDKVSYASVNGRIELVVNDPDLNHGAALGDSHDSIEIFEGSHHNDTMLAFYDSPIEFFGMGGDDELVGNSGNDILDGGDGNDDVFGGGGDDRIFASANGAVAENQIGDKNDGSAGQDWIDFSRTKADFKVEYIMDDHSNKLTMNQQEYESFERVQGSDRDDKIHVNGNVDTVKGGDGNDIISGANVGLSDYEFHGEAGDDVLTGGAGNDEFYAGEGDDTLYGNDGQDEMYGDDGDDTLYGGADNDLLKGGAGNDSLYGGAGNDRLEVGEGANIVIGGDGRDVVVLGDNLTISVTSDNFLRIAHTLNGQEHVNRVQSVENLISLTNPNTTLDLKDIYLSVGGFTVEQEYLDWLDGSYGYDTV